MTATLNVTIGPVDGLNPQHGYAIRIECDGHTILHTAKHPVTGDDLDYAGCLNVAAMYGSARTNRFEVRWGDDTAAHDPQLVCDECGEALCDVEHGDNLEALTGMAQDHKCPKRTP